MGGNATNLYTLDGAIAFYRRTARQCGGQRAYSHKAVWWFGCDKGERYYKIVEMITDAAGLVPHDGIRNGEPLYYLASIDRAVRLAQDWRAYWAGWRQRQTRLSAS